MLPRNAEFKCLFSDNLETKEKCLERQLSGGCGSARHVQLHSAKSLESICQKHSKVTRICVSDSENKRKEKKTKEHKTKKHKQKYSQTDQNVNV